MPTIQLIIRVHNDGTPPQVEGPIEDLVLSFGMLELAKVLIVEHHKAKEKRVQVVPANALVIPKN